MAEEKCPVCVKLVDACKEVGEGKFCEMVLGRLYDGELTADQFVDEILKKKKVAEKLRVAD